MYVRTYVGKKAAEKTLVQKIRAYNVDEIDILTFFLQDILLSDLCNRKNVSKLVRKLDSKVYWTKPKLKINIPDKISWWWKKLQKATKSEIKKNWSS